MRTVVCVTAPEWCGACRTLHPVLTKVCNELGLKLEEIDSDEEPMRAAELEVTSLPTTIVYDGDTEVSRFSGAYPAKRLAALLLGG